MIVEFSVAQLSAEHYTVIQNMEKEPCSFTVNTHPIPATAESDMFLIGLQLSIKWQKKCA